MGWLIYALFPELLDCTLYLWLIDDMTYAGYCALSWTTRSSSCCSHALIVLMKFLSPESIESRLYISILQFTELLFVLISCSGGGGVVFPKWKFYLTAFCELKTDFWVKLHSRAPALNVDTLDNRRPLQPHHPPHFPTTRWSNPWVMLIFSLSQSWPFSLKSCAFPPLFLSIWTQVLNFCLKNLLFKIHFKYHFLGKDS